MITKFKGNKVIDSNLVIYKQRRMNQIIDGLMQELEDAVASGTSITVNDSANAPAKLLPSGNTFQQQYEGYNLLNVADRTFNPSTYDQYYIQNFTLDNTKSYKLKLKYEYIDATFSSSGAMIMAKKDSNYSSLAGTSATTPGTITADITGVSQFSIYLTSRLSSGKIKLSEAMIYEGTEEKPYEPYVGGQASPNKDYPQTIHNVSGENEFLVQNKNWFIDELLSQEENYNSYNENTKLWTTSSSGSYGRSILYNITGTHHNVNITKVIKVKPNTTYTIKFYDFSSSVENMSMEILFNDINGINLSNASSVHPPIITFTTPADCEYLDIARRSSSGRFSFSKIQLEQGTTATPYVEHEEQTAEFTLVEGQKMFLGDYLADNGIHHFTEEMILTGTEEWLKSSSNRFYLRLSANSYKRNTSQTCLSNYFIGQTFVPNNSGQVNAGCVSFYGSPNGQSWEMYINYDENATLEEFKQFLADKYSNGNPVKVQYPLYAEVIESYTELQQQQYNRLKKIMSYYQQTNVNTITAGDLEAILTLGYKKSSNIRIKTLEEQNESILNRLALLEN